MTVSTRWRSRWSRSASTTIHWHSLSFLRRLLPTVLLLLAGGVIVDRIPRRFAMLASDTTRGAAVAVIALLVGLGVLQVWELVVMSVIFGAADALFYPAATAIVPEILPAELLVQASALNATSHTVAQMLIGPALGGLVVAALGYEWAFAIDAASFALSAGCVLAMANHPCPEPSGRSPLADVREGLRYCRSQPRLWATIVGAGVANFAAFSPLGLLVTLLVRNVLRQGPVALGLVIAAGGSAGASRRCLSCDWARLDFASRQCGLPGLWRARPVLDLLWRPTSGSPDSSRW